MLKKIRTYLPFATNEFKSTMAYKEAFFLFIIASLLGSFTEYFLWMAIYGSSDSDTLGGFTRNEMIIYIFINYITASSVCVGLSRWVSQDVIKGTVSMQLIKPIDYRMSLIARATGDMIYIPGLFIWLGLEVYKVTVLHMPIISLSTLCVYLLSMVMSFLIYVLFDFCFGMLAFVTTYIFGLNMVKNSVLYFLSGQLIPLSFCPVAMQKVFEYLPFSSMIYTPTMIYIGKYTGSMLTFVLVRQLVWIVILYILGGILWKTITKRLIVLGG